MNKIEEFNKNLCQLAEKNIPELRSGYTVRVHQKIKEGDKQRIQIFEGLIIAVKHGHGINGTITVRKISNGVGVERVFPIHAPFIEKIEVIRKSKVRRAKLYYIRRKSAKESRLKEIREAKTFKQEEQQTTQPEQEIKPAESENQSKDSEQKTETETASTQPKENKETKKTETESKPTEEPVK